MLSKQVVPCLTHLSKDPLEPSNIGDHFTLGHLGQVTERQGKRSFEITKSHLQKKTFPVSIKPTRGVFVGAGLGEEEERKKAS